MKFSTNLFVCLCMNSLIFNNKIIYLFAAEDLTRSIELYNKQRQGWFEETVTSSLVLERHEAERVENLKALLEKYSKLLSDSSQGCSDVSKS